MALIVDAVEIASKAKADLDTTPFACSSLIPLSGGTVNYIYCGQLIRPLADGTQKVLVKHGEDFAALQPSFKLPTSRCRIEESCLKALAELPPLTSPTCMVRVPKLYRFDAETNTQIQEYLPDSIDLKTYLLRHLAPPAPTSLELICRSLGNGLGAWLRSFHDSSKHPKQSKLQDVIKLNNDMQTLKHTINYSRLVQTVKMFPSILGEAKDIFEQLEAMAKAELSDERKLRIIHGDFWTGNILLPDDHLDSSVQIPILIVDWELCQLGVPALDLGQMIAELYELTLFKNIQAGLWLIEGLTTGYGFLDDDFAYRTAMHVGTHLVCFGSRVPGWGTLEQVEEVVEVGRDLIIKAWEKDHLWFEESALSCLFPRSPGHSLAPNNQM